MSRFAPLRLPLAPVVLALLLAGWLSSVAFADPVVDQTSEAETGEAATVDPVDAADEVIVQPTPFSEETSVVAIDRMLDLEGTGGWLRGGKLPRNLDLADFEARIEPPEPETGAAPAAVGSTQLTPVALERVVRGLPERAEPWNVVVLLDQALASTRTVRWAMGRLAERAEELTALGPVTVWLAAAGEGPKTLLLPTEDAAKLKELLSRLALLTEGDDSVLQGRWAWVEEGAAAGDASPERAASDETETLRRALDERLLRLAEHGRGSGPRRLLLWVTDGFDVDPWRFYGARAEGTEAPEALADHIRDMVRALAADGWIAAALRPPDRDPYRGKAGGVRIGKWRFVGFPPFIAATREAARDPDKSEALLELGDARLAADDVEGAADAYALAYHHFYGDPKTGGRQAVALLRLADSLEILGDRAGARRSRSLAAELDPEAAARHLAQSDRDTGPDVARLLDPLEPLRQLAEATAGAVVADEPALDELLYDLQRRLRLTLQLPAELDAGLYRVDVLWRDEPAPTPAWIRVGESPGVDAASSRRGGSLR